MNELRLGDDVLSQVLSLETRYDERAYLFVLASIEYLQRRLEMRRHVTGPELAGAVRDYAVERFGLLAHSVLEHWGIRKTLDIGRIVFALVGVGLLITQPGDRVEDFDETYDFMTAFDDWSYVWQGVGPGHGGGIRRREVS
jgi:uncharacterized repeat protein (TIGR04138 family)